MDAWLGGCVELELSMRVALLYDSPNCRALRRRKLSPFRSSGECCLKNGFEQSSLAAERPVNRFDDDASFSSHRWHRCPGVATLAKELVGGGLDVATRLGCLLATAARIVSPTGLDDRFH
jgi:hypothetical protein